jgi:predicted HAD superfamily Cof-like phosphohydrolase|tara:strand:- start:540 stop:974 length:435 start_codon:yes stop_codon:yes gene_type:complete
MNKSVGESLAEFHTVFGCKRNINFKRDTIEDVELLVLRKNLIKEEMDEVFEAIKDSHELHVLKGLDVFSNKEENEAHILKELVDLVVVCVGMADTYGWDFDNAFQRVHESNMSKLDDEGKPIYREDGKVIKSKNYKEPYLDDLV